MRQGGLGQGGAPVGTMVFSQEPWNPQVKGMSIGCMKVGVPFGYPALSGAEKKNAPHTKITFSRAYE